MKRLQKLLSVLLTVCFCLTTVSLTAAAADTAKAGDVAVGDTFYFGHYPQSRVDDRALIARLNAQGAPIGSVVTLGDQQYQSIRVTGYAVPGGDQGKIYTEIYGYEVGRTYWFHVETIAWTVLAKDADGVLLMAQKVLAAHEYNKTVQADNTWENSDIRAWLNGAFADAAFTAKEKASILLSDTPNADSFIPGTTGVGGNDTTDKVFLPSIEEITDKSLGFLNADYDHYDDFGNYVGYYAKEAKRQAFSTDFAKGQGVWVDTRNTGDGEVERIDGDPGDFGDDLDNVAWEKHPDGSGREYSKTARYWLRSPGENTTYAAAVLENGRVTTGWPVDYTIVGVRPWMRVAVEAVLDGSFIRPTDTGLFKINATGIDGDIRYRQEGVKLDAGDREVTWETSDSSVATIDNEGNVTTHGVGTVTFTATDVSGGSASKTVEVRYTVWQWLIIIFLFGWIWYI